MIFFNPLFEVQKIIFCLFRHPTAFRANVPVGRAPRVPQYLLYPHLRHPSRRKVGGTATTCGVGGYQVAFTACYILSGLKTSCFCRYSGFFGKFSDRIVKYTSDTVLPFKAGDFSFINRFRIGDTGISTKTFVL